jgi:predicted PurR-regulated permease PerM
LALWVLIFFVVIQQLENNLLVPFVMKKAIGVHPVIILVALLGGAEIAGLVGMLLAVPAAVFLQEMTDDWKTASRRAG